MAERDLLITVKARDEASRVMATAEKSVDKLSKTVKKSSTQFEQFAKQIIGLGAVFATLKRIASGIPEIEAFQEAYWNAVTMSIRGVGAAADKALNGNLGRLLGLFTGGVKYAGLRQLGEEITVLKKLLGETDHAAAFLEDMRAQARQQGTIAWLLTKGISTNTASRYAALEESARAAALAASNIKAPVDVTGAVFDRFSGIDIIGLMGLKDTTKTKLQISDALGKILEDVAKSERIKNIAEELKKVYGFDEATAQKYARTFAEAFVDTTADVIEGSNLTEIIEDTFSKGFKDAAAAIKDEFENLARIGETFASDLFDTLNDNFFRAAKQEFKSFGEFAQSILQGIIDSILRILSRLAASQLLSLGGNLFGPSDPSNGLRDRVTYGTPFVTDGVPGYEGGGGSATTPSSPVINIVIHATDAQSVAALIERNPAAVANAVVTAASRNNQHRTNLRSALG